MQWSNWAADTISPKCSCNVIKISRCEGDNLATKCPFLVNMVFSIASRPTIMGLLAIIAGLASVVNPEIGISNMVNVFVLMVCFSLDVV